MNNMNDMGNGSMMKENLVHMMKEQMKRKGVGQEKIMENDLVNILVLGSVIVLPTAAHTKCATTIPSSCTTSTRTITPNLSITLHTITQQDG